MNDYCYDSNFGVLTSILCLIDDKLQKLVEFEMDKQIKKLQKDTKKIAKQEGELLKADKKRDKVCDMGEKMMKKKK